jgi:two-component system, OmpR family, response regulator
MVRGMSARVLLVEDDDDFSSAVRHVLEREGHVVDTAADGEVGIQLAQSEAYDLVILDIMLPRVNGFKVCAELRSRSLWTPIIMLSAKSGEWDQAESLDAGADDYLTKPVSMVVLLAHVRAQLRRSRIMASREIQWADLVVDPVRRSCRRGSTDVPLSATEMAVLVMMIRCRDLVTRDDLVRGVWGEDFRGDPNIVDVYVSRLRRKLEQPFGHQYIETVRGAGYRMVDEGAG